MELEWVVCGGVGEPLVALSARVRRKTKWVDRCLTSIDMLMALVTRSVVRLCLQGQLLVICTIEIHISNPAYENGGDSYDNGGYQRLDPSETPHSVFREPTEFVPLPHKVTFTRVTCTFKRIVTFIVAIVVILVAAVAIYFIVKAATDYDNVRTEYSSRSVDGSLRIFNVDYNVSYNDPGSEPYRDLAQNLTTKLTAVLSNTSLERYHNRTYITNFESGSVVVNFVYVFNKLFNGSYLEQTVDDVFLANTRPNSDWNVILDPFVIDRKSIKFKAVPLEEEKSKPLKTTRPADVTTHGTLSPTSQRNITTGTTEHFSTTRGVSTDTGVKTTRGTTPVTTTTTTTTTTPTVDVTTTASSTTTPPTTTATTSVVDTTTTVPTTTTATQSVTYTTTRIPTTTTTTTTTSTITETTATAHIPEQFPVRLVGGLGDFEGRVEVERRGQWRSVCDAGWSDVDAQVVCRQLNYTGTARARLGTYFGFGSGVTWLNDVNCRGDERQLASCPATIGDAVTCEQNQEAGVTCDFNNIGAGVLSIHLVGGSSPSEGRVEVFYSATWGTICGKQFSAAHANVVCRMLDYNGNTRVVSPDRYNQSSDTIWLSSLECSGDESTLAVCEHAAWGQHSCSHTQDLAVQCDYSDIGTTTPRTRPTTTTSGKTGQVIHVKLVDGPDESRGRVEVNNGGEWGTICRDLFNDRSAEVLCRMLGQSVVGARYEQTRYGAGTGNIWLNHVVCNGTESSILDCLHDDWGDQSQLCTHWDDVSISCDNAATQTTLASSTSPDVAMTSRQNTRTSTHRTTTLEHTVHTGNAGLTTRPTTTSVPKTSSTIIDALLTVTQLSVGNTTASIYNTNVKLYNTVYNTNVKFYNTVSNTNVKFYTNVYSTSVKLYSTFYNTNVKLYNTVCNANVKIYNTVYNTNVKLYNTVYNTSVKFYNNIFNTNVKFYNTVFDTDVKFRNAVFNTDRTP
ncbi:hypothetical protein LSAT2_016836 [Lamellibrachia satsuma]|nr:hypothetical protein LSAT2_016836 [Lamellibrachia satsuma]